MAMNMTRIIIISIALLVLACGSATGSGEPMEADKDPGQAVFNMNCALCHGRDGKAGINGAKLWKDGVPEYIQLQVMHQLAVTGKQAADVAVLICGQELQIHRIERDETMIAQLIALEEQFWELVTAEKEPPVDASESASTALRCLYPQDTGEDIDLSEDESVSSAFAQLQQVRQLMSDWESQEALLKHQIQQRMASASFARFAGGTVSWKRSKDSKFFNAALFQQEQPELAKAYMGTKPGSRRFLLHAEN